MTPGRLDCSLTEKLTLLKPHFIQPLIKMQAQPAGIKNMREKCEHYK